MNWNRALLFACLAAAGCGDTPPTRPPARTAAAAAPAPAPVLVGPEIAGFYRDRGNRPLWVAGAGLRPEALDLARRVVRAADDGLDPERYGARELEAALAAARSGDKAALAHAELLLTRAYVTFVRDLHAPQRRTMIYAEADLAPAAPSARALLDSTAAAPTFADGYAGALRMNPLYAALQRGYGRWRSARGAHDAAVERLIRANLDRARAIPASGGRYIIVDTASARLWMIDGERVGGPMPVIVGKPHMQTPMLASRITHAALNPYWNVPPDLARDRARRVLKEGPGLIGRQRLQILSDWGDSARPIPASAVNWGAVAAGKRSLRLRQLPGGDNVMGAVKFMMTNDLGIYLHDFPDKSLFARADRRLSSGCVRLSDAPRLARWLFRGAAPRPSGPAPEQRVDLPEPVPVYITYLTVLPGAGGLTFQPDSYARDLRGGTGRAG